MRNFIAIALIISSYCSISQNRGEIQADDEMQGFFKNYWEFNLDSLKAKNFEHVKNVNPEEFTFCGFQIERQRDAGITESVYIILLSYKEGEQYKNKEYKVYIFSNNDSIFGLINCDETRKKTNYYFDFKKLQEILDYHNNFYQSELTIADFVNQVIADRTYGYFCGEPPVVYKVPRYDNLRFDNKKNIVEFRKWLKSFNLELQSFGVDALEYLEKNKKLRLSTLDRKLISNIKERNSVLKTCAGGLDVYEKVY